MTKGKHTKGKKMTIPKGKPIMIENASRYAFNDEVIKEFKIINENLGLMNKVDRYLIGIVIKHRRTINALIVSQIAMALYLIAWLVGWSIGAW